MASPDTPRRCQLGGISSRCRESTDRSPRPPAAQKERRVTASNATKKGLSGGGERKRGRPYPANRAGGGGRVTRQAGCTSGRPEKRTDGSFFLRRRRVQSVLVGVACALLRTAWSASGRSGRMHFSRSDIKRSTQSREHSALVHRTAQAPPSAQTIHGTDDPA